ncbi:TPA: capsule biosynthesis protein, partial [Legionella pneumophila]|nr:capsule biosynthesis protein [Legionella pneumophila]
QINLIIIDGVPHTSIDILLYYAAKFFNIKTLLLYQHCIPNRFMYFTDIVGRSVDFSLYYSDKDRPVRNEYKDYKISPPTRPFYMRDFSYLFYDEKKFLADLKATIKYEKNDQIKKEKYTTQLYTKIRNILTSFKSSKDPGINKTELSEYIARFLTEFDGDFNALESLSSALLKFIKYTQYENRLNSLSQKTVDLTVPYVYFPLSFQPESTTECLGGPFADILTAVEKVRCLIPPDWKIYLKDHVIQYEFGRDKIFFDRLKAIPNIILVDRFYSSFELIKNSQFVATLNGTPGWEAIHMGKKALTFGSIYYQGLPGVFVYNQSLKLEDILNTTIDKHLLENAINTHIGRLEIGVVAAEHSAIVEDFDEETNAKLVLDFILRFSFEQNTSINNAREYNYEAS